MNPFHTILNEDLGAGDITGVALVPADAVGCARVVAKDACVVAGLEVVAQLWRQVDAAIVWNPTVRDGDRVTAGTTLAQIEGPLRALLRGERVTLNLLQHLCGVATLTRAFVDVVHGSGIQIRDTRKTIPGLRMWQKAAVVAGGGVNHRMRLDDQYLIKSNHLVPHGTLAEALKYFARYRQPGIPLEIEVRALDEIDVALGAQPDWIMLDNFTPAQIQQAIPRIAGRSKVEVSGGITLANVGDYVIPGVTALAIGALTHSPRAIDIHMILSV